VIAITGSFGKTTCTQSLIAILDRHFAVNAMRNADNTRRGIALTLLRTRPQHRYTVIEVGTRRRGALWRASWQLNPDIAVILKVDKAHSNHHPTLADVAHEKAQLLRRLTSNGLAVLNGDDPWVRAMAERCNCRVVTFGLEAGNDFRADEISARWPSRLQFSVHAAGESAWVNTNFVGVQWVATVLGAIATAVNCGVPLAAAAEAMESVQPFRARMEPVVLPSGAVLLRDETHGSVSTIPAAMKLLRDADVRRRVVVAGDTWDTGLADPVPRQEDLGRRVAEGADFAVFVSVYGAHAVRAAIRHGMAPDCVRHFAELPEASEFLKSELGPGDLVLLKGQAGEHLTRIFYAQFGEVACRKQVCRRPSCDSCEELGFVPAAGISFPAGRSSGGGGDKAGGEGARRQSAQQSKQR